MKIVIVGGGISGLVSYLFLKKHLPNPALPAEAHEFFIYESHDASRSLERQLHSQDAIHQTTNTIAIGGGLGLGPNGLNVIKRLDESLFHEIVRSGHSITQWRMQAARGWELGSVAIQTEEEPPMNSSMIGRQTLWHCIREHVPDTVIVQKKISKVKAAAGKRPFISFADDTPDVECDVVLGCDGLRSIVRKAIFSDVGEEGTEKYPPHYE
jgi:2-polyprenyl-6-methoxyphenol hydroxylase-like FAD-dependent oxidoreductase